MQFKKLILAVFAASALFMSSESALQKTEDEALKFLVDGGHISSEAVVQSYAIDRNGDVRIRVTDGDQIYNYGLEEAEDTYEITFMNKKKAPKTTTKADEKAQIQTLIGENMEVLKGGQVVSITKQSGRRSKHGAISIVYKLKNKEYDIEAYYDSKRGALSISSVKENKNKAKKEQL